MIMLQHVSPKVIAGTIATILASGLLASLNYLITPEGQALFATLPPVVTIGLMAIITGAAAALAGYVKRDPAREEPSDLGGLDDDPDEDDVDDDDEDDDIDEDEDLVEFEDEDGDYLPEHSANN